MSPLGNGLINQTFLAKSGDTAAVLQRLAPIFSPVINENIAAVTAALANAGLVTSRLIPAGDGRKARRKRRPPEPWLQSSMLPSRTCTMLFAVCAKVSTIRRATWRGCRRH